MQLLPLILSLVVPLAFAEAPALQSRGLGYANTPAGEGAAPPNGEAVALEPSAFQLRGLGYANTPAGEGAAPPNGEAEAVKPSASESRGLGYANTPAGEGAAPPKRVAVGAVSDVSRYRCIDGRVYSDDCNRARVNYARRAEEARNLPRVICILDELREQTGRKCAIY
jgi:hypothetical protein